MSHERVVSRSWQSVRVSMASLTSKWIELARWHARPWWTKRGCRIREREREKERVRSFLRKLSPPTAHSTTRYHSGFKNLLADSRRDVISSTVREIYKSETCVNIRIDGYLNAINLILFLRWYYDCGFKRKKKAIMIIIRLINQNHLTTFADAIMN